MSNWDWSIKNQDFLKRTIKRCQKQNIILPTFNELKHPKTISKDIQSKLKDIDFQDLHPLNLFRINWQNDKDTNGIGDINYLEIPKEITGTQELHGSFYIRFFLKLFHVEHSLS